MSALFESLIVETGMRSLDLQRIISRAPIRYKHYAIQKRSGGWRHIAQPARELKVVQRALTTVLLRKLPVHECATAYMPGSSILANAKPHSSSGPILKLDLEAFFPSLKSRDWANYCARTKCLIDPDDIRLTSKVLFHKPPGDSQLRLAIGAPSSPILSNILMYEIDCKIAAGIAPDHVVYTRYADDMTFSAPRTGHLTGVMSKVAKILRETGSPSLSINGDKTTYVTKKYHRTVTGLTLANDGRVTIGRQRKRIISAALHNASLNELNADELRILAGMLAFVNAVEPSFLDILRRKYGTQLVEQIQKRVWRGGRATPHKPPLAPA